MSTFVCYREEPRGPSFVSRSGRDVLVMPCKVVSSEVEEVWFVFSQSRLPPDYQRLVSLQIHEKAAIPVECDQRTCLVIKDIDGRVPQLACRKPMVSLRPQ